MTISVIAGLLGGLGLFLLGMRLMTTGLRKTAGSGLKTILGQWTNTPIRGILSGFCITALVQSSSAVTIATIGFVNAGLMTLRQSIGVIFGSNIGTTATGWLVALVGFDIQIKALALPLVGLGAILRISGENTRRSSFGDALTGFGLFFLGIEVLKNTFQTVHPLINFSMIGNESIAAILLFLGVGFLLTLLMQSSSAAMALVLTAAASGMATPTCAAAAVIGTNMGTTSTAALSVIGATNNAKKVAAAHIMFNFGTGLIGLAFLPVLLAAVQGFQHIFSESISVSVTLALFHTVFNVLGVCLFTPFTEQISTFLNSNIGTKSPEKSTPRYLDMNVLTTPILAMDALFLELGRLGEQTRLIVRKVLKTNCRYPMLLRDLTHTETLISTIRSYIVTLQNKELLPGPARALPKMLRILQYYTTTLEIIYITQREHPTLNHIIAGAVDDHVYAFKMMAKHMLSIAQTPCAEEFETLGQQFDELQQIYQELKTALLESGADGTLEISHMADLLEFHSNMKRMVEQTIKGALFWAETRNISETCRKAAEQNSTLLNQLEEHK